MKSIIVTAFVSFLLSVGVGCKKDSSPSTTDFDTPSNAAPAGLVGNWASGFASTAQMIDVYTGKYVGDAWKSGEFFKITSDGKLAEFYYSGESEDRQSATKATGTIAFDAESTASEGTFTFYAVWGHYNGWGNDPINRDATKDELANRLTAKYYYRMDGEGLKIEPKAPVNDYSAIFELIN